MAKTLLIAHRGASAFRPEHTLEAYSLAIDLGADFIEPDLVTTRDGILVARHENELSGTTNVVEHPEFSNRFTSKFIDGYAVSGWFTEDFTLAELKTLRVKERIPNIRPQNTVFDGLFTIPTLEEIINLVNRKSLETGRKIGIYPETKHPTFFAKEGAFFGGTKDGKLINFSLGKLLIDTLMINKFTDFNRVFIQSFEFENLIELQKKIMPNAGVNFPLIQLYGSTELPVNSCFQHPYDIFFNAKNGENMSTIYGSLATTTERGVLDTLTGYGNLDNRATLQWISDTYAQGVGPWKNNFLLRIPINEDGEGSNEITTQLTGEVTSFVEDAHRAGLLVHCYTLRPEKRYLTLKPDGKPQSAREEVIQLIKIGVDGLFCDNPRIGNQNLEFRI
ncbi:MAG: glycerophosphodiester phosphodiesterase family protein [Crocosphaera sp.]|nr:glycerophosphodiester phosphodiesterase family protein [Crocosphaera sp.]